MPLRILFSPVMLWKIDVSKKKTTLNGHISKLGRTSTQDYDFQEIYLVLFSAAFFVHALPTWVHGRVDYNSLLR